MSPQRTIVLTGATRGCGRALVDVFAQEGHVVHGCGRSADAIAALNRELGEPHCFTAVDIAADAAVQARARETIDRAGVPDLVLNAAGVINRSAPLWEVSAEEFSAVVDINLKGTASVMRAFLPPMVARRSGVVVNFSSGWGRGTAPEVAPYCATKWAVEGLSQAVAQEVPPGVAVLALNPGIIHTEMLESCFGQSARSYDDPETWAQRAAPFLLALGPADNGSAASVP
ncbi:MAG: SDR family oxidoreductase [bacterium]|nr:SDR family oxidoreductase [bacterium]